MNWKNLGSIPKIPIFNLFHELGKIPARATFKDINFQSLYEMGKTWRYSLSPESKAPILNLQMNWGNLCPNLSFTDENKIVNLHKAGYISALKEKRNSFRK